MAAFISTQMIDIVQNKECRRTFICVTQISFYSVVLDTFVTSQVWWQAWVSPASGPLHCSVVDVVILCVVDVAEGCIDFKVPQWFPQQSLFVLTGPCTSHVTPKPKNNLMAFSCLIAILCTFSRLALQVCYLASEMKTRIPNHVVFVLLSFFFFPQELEVNSLPLVHLKSFPKSFLLLLVEWVC